MAKPPKRKRKLTRKLTAFDRAVLAAKGGRGRAKSLTRSRRVSIAKSGYLAMLQSRAQATGAPTPPPPEPLPPPSEEEAPS